jgi:hypothetical protein
MKFTIALASGKTLVGEANEAHAGSANGLLARLAEPAATLATGERIDVEIEWSTIRLCADAITVTASEPDYLHDPTRFLPSLAFTSGVLDAERKLLQALQLVGDPPLAASYARVSEAAMRAVSAVGFRHHERDRLFSGWQIVGIEHGPKDQFGQYMPRELAALHPAWLAAMSLPAGWAFRCVGRTIMDCVSPEETTHVVMISLDV